ncbi:RNA-guided endonuclease InsQ/TnpB family protein [Clostridium sp. B9]|uniref:RNA-guided endonuclease InsQ/TnpB family protein n=1 Tax=Clostridium sp. B9 TaxID=3423224 RepID=UPI003D2F0B9D
MKGSMRVEKHTLKDNHILYKKLDDYCFKSKNLYNYANYQVRQVFIITSKLSKNEEISNEEQLFLDNINSKVDEFNKLKKINYDKAKTKAEKEKKEFKKKLTQINYFSKDNKYLGYDFLEFLVKDGIDYKSLMAQTSQQCLQLLDKNWKSFFEAIKVWNRNKNKFSGMPKLPKYLKKNGRNLVVFTNQNCKLKDNKIKFPTILGGFKLETKVGNLQQVRILPRNRHFVIEVIYKQDTKEKLNDNKRYLSIDIGLNNLATICNNIGEKPIVINGKSLKSINQYYNKKTSYYKNIAKRLNNLDYTKRLNRLTIKRNNKINDYLHKASKFIIEYANELSCNTIVIGNNKDWKRESSMSKKANQNFVGIPHQKLIEMIQYKTEKYGINIVLVEESYTSGTSFIDNELPVKENYNKSRRIHRGLFLSNKGIKINADVNGAYQILKKEFPNAYANGIVGVGLHPIIVNCF